jgi:hypothetical protein
MIKIPFNKNITGDLLVQEFANAGFTTEVVIYPGNLIELNGLNEADTLKANEILDAHVPVDLEAVAAAKAVAKAQILERLGITAEEAQLLLS